MNRHRLILAAVAGVAMTVSGCSHGAPAALRPLSSHLVSHVSAHAAKSGTAAKHKSARAALAKAIRTTLAAHSASFRETLTISGVNKGGISPNPLLSTAGTLDFDRDAAELHFFPGPHANQPQSPPFTAIVVGGTVYVGDVAAFNDEAPLLQGTVDACNTVDSWVSVLQDVKGRIVRQGKLRMVDRGPALFTRYVARVDFGQQLLDCSGGQDPVGRQLLGKFATEYVWVDSSGRIVKIAETIDTGQVHLSGVPPQVTSITASMWLANFGEGTLVALPSPSDKTYRLTGTRR